MTKKVAFATQKGGVGKTTLTVLTASYLHYVKDYDVAIIDCDYPQNSIHEMRERDLKMAMEDDYYKQKAYQQFTTLNKKGYMVVESSPEEAIADGEYVVKELQPDFIFFDIPGTINNQHIVETLSDMDYIIALISADRVVVESTLQFVVSLNDNFIKARKTRIKDIFFLWNLVDGREKNELYQVYEEVITKLGFPILKTFIPDSKRFRREQSNNHKAVFRSTIFPADKNLVKGSNLELLINELLEVLK